MQLGIIAVRNVGRNKFRTILTVLGVAVALIAFIALRTVLSAWNVAVEYAAKDRIGTRHKVSFIIPLPSRYMQQIRTVKGIKAATWANWFGGKDPRQTDHFFATLAVDPPSFLEVYDECQLPPEQKQAWFEDRKGAVVGETLARKLNVKVGSRITLQGTIFPGDWQFNVVGIYKSSRKSFDNSQFLFHWAYLNETRPARSKDMIGWIISRIDSSTRTADISLEVDKMFEEKDAPTITMSERAMNLSFLGMISALLTAVDIISFLILIIMTGILGNTIAMGVRERTSEYGVLRALGFLPRHITLFILGESMTVGLLGGIVGVGLAYPLVERGMGRWLEENMGGFFPYFRIEPTTALVAIGIALLLGAVAAAAPAYGAAKLEVTQALRRVG